MKKFLIITCVAVLIIIGVFSVLLYRYARSPGAKFVLNMSELTTPKNYVIEEKTIDLGDRTMGVRIFRHRKVKTDKYYMIVHGLTPQDYNHPAMRLIAASICDATGMNVLQPCVEFKIKEQGPSLIHVIDNIEVAYKRLVKEYPGRYRAMGGCLGATSLLIALERLPGELYPKKILLMGPIFNGRELIKFYNKAGVDVDFIVKLAVSLTSDIYTDEEKKMIRKAFNATRPGPTDKSEMKKILGYGLYDNLLTFKMSNKEIEDIDIGKVMLRKKQFPDCEYFILHTKNDSIVPGAQGEGLFTFMKEQGLRATFIGTEIYDHTRNTVTVTGFVKEMKYLVNFFDQVFKGDDELEKQ